MPGLDVGVSGLDSPGRSLITPEVRQRINETLKRSDPASSWSRGAASGLIQPGRSPGAPTLDRPSFGAPNRSSLQHTAVPTVATGQLVTAPRTAAAGQMAPNSPGPLPRLPASELKAAATTLHAMPLALRTLEVPGTTLTKPGTENLAFTRWARTTTSSQHPEMYEGPPTADQIRQGARGNCFELGVIGAVTQVSPTTITNRLRAEGDRVEMSIYDTAAGVDVSHVYDNQVPWYSTDGVGESTLAAKPAGDAWWVSMAEKGLALQTPGGYDTAFRGGGTPEIVATMEALTGRPAQVVSNGFTRRLDIELLHTTFSDAVANGKPVYASVGGIADTTPQEVIDVVDRTNAVAGHAHWLRGYDPDTRTVHLGNPWGRRHLDVSLADYHQMGGRVIVGDLADQGVDQNGS